MARPISFILPVIALLIVTSCCCAENVYCVTPTTTSCSSCPPNSTHCATLFEYAQDAELYFTSNTTMVFLSGDHVLDTNIRVANVTRLTMHGQSSSDNTATIVRNGSVGFSFTNMVDFNVYSLALTSYNRSWSYGHCPGTNSALLLTNSNTKLVNCSFHDNIGTALAVYNTNITLEGNNFTHNQCGCMSSTYRWILGCGITAYISNMTFTGNTTFLKNRRNEFEASEEFVNAGAILAVATSLHFTGTSNFIDNVNSANSTGNYNGGAIHITDNAILTFHGTTNFMNNSAGKRGGAIYTSDNVVLVFNGINTFSGNSANYEGGAICAEFNISLAFIGTTNFNNNSAGLRSACGGAIGVYSNVVLAFSGTNNFINNSDYFGGAICAQLNIFCTFSGTTEFSNNLANGHGGAVIAAINTLLSFTGTSSFINNSAMKGGAITAYRNSTLTFDGSISFINNGYKMNIDNESSCGGAMYLSVSSAFSILPHTTVHWENNHAYLGGAIYVSDFNSFIYCTETAPLIPREECFFQLSDHSTSSGIDVKLVFKNNSADDAGSVLYGGKIDNCKLTGLDSYSSGEVFDTLVHIIDTNHNITSNISSGALRICLCKNNFPDCGESPYLQVYPGETFQISVVGVGQRDGTVSSVVRSTFRSTVIASSIDPRLVNLLDYQYLQPIINTCTKLNYTVFSLYKKVVLMLYAEGSPCSKLRSGPLNISVNLNQTCPPGFNISEETRSCVCEPRLTHYTNHCNITNGVGRITRDSNQHFWVGYEHSSLELILHPHCPFDYCVNDAVVFPLNNTDMQCTYNRSGLLCGACKEGYSLVLGTHQCMKCTNSHLVLLIPFALMGVALVFLLLVCRLTVATGTLSGLVFYANIVRANSTIFLPVESTDTLSVFIAWISLDFGIETCFYNGLDAYSKTWLQFVFPAYIWMLVGLMILISHFSQRFANILGSNPVSVLATLILLSYAKILHTLIIAVYITHLEYPANYNRKVWLHDANVNYLSGEHIPLFLVAVLVFLFLFLPYTLLLLFGQWLQVISHLRLFSWVNSSRLKPFMDSYHAPYKAKHRYWPGLLLVLRFVLLLVFAFNDQQDPSINLLAILVGTGILQLWAWVSHGVYKNWCLDALEGSFILNLIILGAATYHVNQSGGSQLAVGYTSVSIALGTFVSILVYHILQQFRHTKLWKKVPKLNLRFKKLNTKQKVDNHMNDPTESVNLDQLREPWLEDLLQPTHSNL